jgi:hypothetical protein
MYDDGNNGEMHYTYKERLSIIFVLVDIMQGFVLIW